MWNVPDKDNDIGATKEAKVRGEKNLIKKNEIYISTIMHLITTIFNHNTVDIYFIISSLLSLITQRNPKTVRTSRGPSIDSSGSRDIDDDEEEDEEKLESEEPKHWVYGMKEGTILKAKACSFLVFFFLCFVTNIAPIIAVVIYHYFY